MGDASHYHATLAEGFRRKGHSVTLVSAGSGWMNTPRDIDISRPFKGKLGGALLYAQLSALLRGRLRGFDVVQIAGPLFLQLLPHRNLNIFRKLRRYNGSMVVCALATDTPYIDYCLKPSGPLAYNEWCVGRRPSPYALTDTGQSVNAVWHSPALKSMCYDIYSEADGILTALYEYHLAISHFFPDRPVAYAGIPVDSAGIPPRKLSTGNDVNIFLGRHADRISEKGTEILANAARQAIGCASRAARLSIVENLPYTSYLEAMTHADIVLDQIYSYSPATNALLAMSMGIPAVSGGEKDYYRFIGEESGPVINALPDNPDAIAEQIRDLIDNPDLRSRIGNESRLFAEKHNSVTVVADRCLDFYHRLQS